MEENMDLSNYLAIAKKAARAAGELLMERLGQNWRVEFKGEVDPVTEVDKASEKLLVEMLSDLAPETDIVAEEEAYDLTGKELCWVVDPLDATVNYSHRFRAFCVSIGLEQNGVPIVGAVYDPVNDEMFTATTDGPACSNDVPISVSVTETLGRSLLATGFPYDRRTNPENNLDHFVEITPACQGIRRVGSAALDLCWTAAGRFDGYWELSLAPWDISAGRLIVQRAGGRVTDFAGGPIDSHTRYIVATNGLIHDPLLSLLARNRKDLW
jgi:myo-inositol-1(or 4)-monophosphatase